MKLNDFNRLRDGLRLNAAPADATERREFAQRLQEALRATGLFHTVDADQTDDGEQLVIALAEFAPDVDTTDAAHALERAWIDRIAYPFWAAHWLLTEDGHVELRGASRKSQLGHYVTVHVVLQRTEAPVSAVADVFVPTQAARATAPAEVTVPTQHRRGFLSRLTGDRR